MQVLTDAGGNYSVILEAGSYVIYVPQFNALTGTVEMVPTTVTILPGQVTRFDINIYTGIMMMPVPEFTPLGTLLILATAVLALGVIRRTREGFRAHPIER